MEETETLEINRERIRILSAIAAPKLPEICEHFNLKLRHSYNKMTGCCPIHSSDNNSAFSIFFSGHTVPGYYQCYTAGCHNQFRGTLSGFVRGVMSHQELGWDRGDGITKTVPFMKGVTWLAKFCGFDRLEDIDVNSSAVYRSQFYSRAAQMGGFTPKNEQGRLYGVDQLAKSIQIPSPYFLSRGFSPRVLKTFQVGDLTKVPSHQMNDRAIVPILTDDGNSYHGVIGRSIHEKCPKCGNYHRPTNLSCSCISKWSVSTKDADFSDKAFLYKAPGTDDILMASRCGVMVEGPGDVWRLREAGILNAFAVMGAGLSTSQSIQLEKSGITSCITMFDRDDAGKSATAQVQDRLGSFPRVYPLQYASAYHDVGEMPVEYIQNEIRPFILSKMRV
jgi:5S rRNA maturation endonuclease (ribonuclease M5)